MLEVYFEDARTLTRLRSGPTGPFLDGFARSLQQSGYSKWTVRGYLRAAAHLGQWLQLEGFDIPSLGIDALRGFGAHLPTCSCLRRNKGGYVNALAGARLFLKHLDEQDVLSYTAPVIDAAVPESITKFEHWMRDHRGVTDSTLATYRKILVELHYEVGEPIGFTASLLRQFVTDRAARHGRSCAKKVVTAVRMFVRYAVTIGWCPPQLLGAVPTIAVWRLSSLPAYISPADVERLIETADPGTPSGLRDRAVILLLARLGLRAGDITGMRLDDIDWDAGTLLVAGKSRSASRLPLPQDAGDAVLAYLASGRPNSEDPHVFLRLRAPIGKIQSSMIIAGIVNRLAKCAGVRMPRGGAHVLRHSFATALVRDGVPLSAVSKLLRHSTEQTTAHYAKVDLPALRRIAQPWPGEVSPC